jgi:hypothetical protein
MCEAHILITVALWLRHYATSLMVVGSRPDGMNEFFKIT